MIALAGQPVRVLHLYPDTRSLRDLYVLYARALDEPPFESRAVFLRGEPDPELARQLGGHAMFLDLPRRSLEGLRLRARWRLWRWCRTQPRFDLVVAHRFKALALALALHRLGLARQVFGVVHEIGQFEGHRRRMITHAIRAPLTLIGVSAAVRSDLLQRFPAYGERRIEALPNAVPDPPPVDRMQALAALDLDPQRFWFGSVGRLARIKGHDVLLRAFAPLAHEAPRVGLALLGSGPEEAGLRDLCRELGIDDQVTFCGWRPNARGLLAAFDSCVFPSRNEAFGLAIAEAMAAGRPVIASAVGGIPQVVGDQALLVSAEDVAALTGALRRIHADADLRQTMGAGLHARWQAQFSPRQFVRQLQAFAGAATRVPP